MRTTNRTHSRHPRHKLVAELLANVFVFLIFFKNYFKKLPDLHKVFYKSLFDALLAAKELVAFERFK